MHLTDDLRFCIPQRIVPQQMLFEISSLYQPGQASTLISFWALCKISGAGLSTVCTRLITRGLYELAGQITIPEAFATISSQEMRQARPAPAVRESTLRGEPGRRGGQRRQREGVYSRDMGRGNSREGGGARSE